MESNEKSKNTSALPTLKSTNKDGINNDSRRFIIPGLKARGFQLIVSCVIPGASSPEQILANLQAAALPALSTEQMQAVREIYDQKIKPLVHYRW